jgi:release factor glutamine methyltransferase
MGTNIHTIKDIRFYLAKELTELYTESEIGAITNIIIKTVFGISRLHQLYNSDQTISNEQAAKIIDISGELKTGKPIQYILGETSFYDCQIRLNSATLIPRPETEELVDLIIHENKGFSGKIIDFGTGSGCIAIALAVNLLSSKISGIDISEEAISIAKENARLNNVNISFASGDIFNLNLSSLKKVGIVVSNPPYVLNSEKKSMLKNVLDFEPTQALFVSDSEPLAYYRAISETANKILMPGGKLYFEINEAMGKQMTELLDSFSFCDIRVVKDINSKDRFIKGTKNG